MIRAQKQINLIIERNNFDQLGNINLQYLLYVENESNSNDCQEISITYLFTFYSKHACFDYHINSK